MGVRIGSGLSTEPDARVGAAEAAAAARDALGGRACDLAVVFASGAHLAAPEATLEGIHEALAPAELVGCGAAGVIGERREVERGHGGGGLGGGARRRRRRRRSTPRSRRSARATACSAGCRTSTAPRARSCSPTRSRSRPTRCCASSSGARRCCRCSAVWPRARSPDGDDAALPRRRGRRRRRRRRALRRRRDPALRLAGRRADRAGADDHRRARARDRRAGRAPGAREAARDDRGARPPTSSAGPGRAADGHRHRREQARLRPGRLPRARARRRRPGHRPGRGRHADVRPGQVVRLHARDAASADRDLREALGARMLGARRARRRPGALLFSCNGRGAGMFGHAHHDAAALDDELGGAPAAGFFAAGEIGPVGGEYFLHGFTATVAVFGAAHEPRRAHRPAHRARAAASAGRTRARWPRAARR